MDLRHIFPGAYPRDTELAQPQRSAAMAIHGLAKDVIEGRLDDPAHFGGTVSTFSVYVAGFEPVYLGNLTLKLKAGRVYKLGALDDQIFSNIAAESSEVMQQYTSKDITLQASQALDDSTPVTIFGGFTAPGSGTNKYRIQVKPIKHDGTNQTLNFYNANDPGNPNPVQKDVDRLFHVHFGVTTTTDGTEPASLGADWVSLYLVAVAAGATQIQAANVTLYSTAPLLGGIRALVTRAQWLKDQLAAVDTMINGHLTDAVDAHDATAISFAPEGAIGASTVQAAIVEAYNEAKGDAITGSRTYVDNRMIRVGLTIDSIGAWWLDLNAWLLTIAIIGGDDNNRFTFQYGDQTVVTIKRRMLLTAVAKIRLRPAANCNVTVSIRNTAGSLILATQTQALTANTTTVFDLNDGSAGYGVEVAANDTLGVYIQSDVDPPNNGDWKIMADSWLRLTDLG